MFIIFSLFYQVRQNNTDTRRHAFNEILNIEFHSFLYVELVLPWTFIRKAILVVFKVDPKCVLHNTSALVSHSFLYYDLACVLYPFNLVWSIPWEQESSSERTVQSKRKTLIWIFSCKVQRDCRKLEKIIKRKENWFLRKIMNL